MRRNFHATKYPYSEFLYTAKISYDQRFVRRNFLRQNFLTAKLPYGEVSSRRSSHAEKYPTAKFPRAKFKFTVLIAIVFCYMTKLVHFLEVFVHSSQALSYIFKITTSLDKRICEVDYGLET